MSVQVGRFRRMRGTACWISPVRRSVVARAQRARGDDDPDAWRDDVTTYGVKAFVHALGVQSNVDLAHRRLGLLGRTVQIATYPLGARVRPTYYVAAPAAHGADEVFVTLLRDGDYPDLVLAGGMPADRVQGSHVRIGDLDGPLEWVCRLAVQDTDRRAAALREESHVH